LALVEGSVSNSNSQNIKYIPACPVAPANGTGVVKIFAFPVRVQALTGRPLGSDLLIDELEVLLGKQLRKKKTGPKGQWKNRDHK